MKTTDKKIKASKVFNKIAREIFSLAFWSYLFLNTFCLNVDASIEPILTPHLHWVLEYKILIFLGFFTISIYLLDRKVFLLNLAFILFYPIIFLYRVLSLSFGHYIKKKWQSILALLIAITPFIPHFFRQMKLRFIGVSILFFSSIIILVSSNKYVLSFCLMLVFISLVIHFYVKIRTLFSSKQLFENDPFKTSFLSDDGRFIKSINTEYQNLSVLNVDTSEYQKKKEGNIRSLLFFNKISQWLIDIEKSLLKKSVFMGCSILSVLYSFVLVSACFSFLFYGLYKIDYNSFRIEGVASNYFLYLLFSSENLVSHSTYGITPTSYLTQSLATLETIIAALFGIFSFAVINSVFKRRYEQDINDILCFFESARSIINSQLSLLYKLSTDEATKELGLEDAPFIKFIPNLPPEKQ